MPILTTLALASSRGFGFSIGGLVDVVRIFEGSDSITFPDNVSEVEYLIVAGGGSGGVCASHVRGGAGGGGAGGVRLGTGFPVDGGATYTVQVGGGGARSTPYGVGFGGLPPGLAGLPGFGSFLQGGDPTVVHIGTNGGGAGGGSNPAEVAARNGGSGGGGTQPSQAAGSAIAISPANGHADPSAYPGVSQSSPFPVQGHDGGAVNPTTAPAGGGVHIIGAGGGGAGGQGQTGGSPGPAHPAITAGCGGNAISSDITGTSKFYGAGGSAGVGGYPGDPAEQGAVSSGMCSSIDGVGGKGSTPSGASGTIDAVQATGSGGGGGNARHPSGGAVNDTQYNGAGAGGVVVLKYRAPRQSIVYIISSTKEVTVPTGASTLDYLVCSGGGGCGASAYAGGGGGGGVRLGTGYPVTPGDVYTVVTGTGGVGASSSGGYNPGVATAGGGKGGDSYIYKSSPSNSFLIGSNGGGGSNPTGIPGGVATQGGAGGTGSGGTAAQPGAGGSGDTGTINSTISGENVGRSPVTQGYDGGAGGGYPTAVSAGKPENSGGGGGAGGAGGNVQPAIAGASDGRAGDGGKALVSEISGFSRGYGGGGGGGDKHNFLTQNTDGTYNVPNNRTGGNGGGIGPANHPTAAGNPVLRGGGAFGTHSLQSGGCRSNGESSTGGGGGGVGEDGAILGSQGGSGVVVLKFNF